MEYPGTKLTRPIRRAILITFFALFFIITPIIIMYTEGYRYDWQNGRRREIGAVSIDIEPTNATVEMDTVKITSGMPIRLNNITPRKYHVRISAPDFYNWEKDIEVLNKQTVYIKEISLIRKSEPEFVAAGKANAIAISPDNNWLALVDNRTVKILNLKTNQATNVDTFLGTTPIKFTWADNNNWLTISNENTPFNILTIVNADNPEKKYDLTALVKQKIVKWQWRETTDPELYYSTASEIKSFKPLTGNDDRVAANKYFDWYMENGTLWTIQMATNTDNIKIFKDTIGFASEFLIDDSSNLPQDGNSVTIVKAIRNQVLLKSKTQPQMYLATNQRVYKIAGDNLLISRYNNWWLFWTPWELTSYSEGGEPILLNRSGEGLRQVWPLDKYNTLGLIWNNKTTVLFPYYSVTHDFIDSPTNDTAIDINNHIFYFSAKIDDQEGIWKLSY